MLPSKDAMSPREKVPTASFAQAKDANSMDGWIKMLLTYLVASSYLTMYVLSCNLLNASCGAP